MMNTKLKLRFKYFKCRSFSQYPDYFFNWAESNKNITDRLVTYTHTKNKGYGLKAKKDIKRSEIMISIKSDIWSKYSIDHAIKYVKDNNPSLSTAIKSVASVVAPNNQIFENEIINIVSMAARLLDAFNENNDEYYKYLAHSLSYSMPHCLNMNDKWLACLKGTYCGADIELRRHMFNFIAENLFVGKELQFKQALGIIANRGIGGNGLPFALLPYLDLVNHSATANAEHYYDSQTESFQLRALSDICEDDEILINYGNFRTTNSTVYLYGFADRVNLNDRIYLQLPVLNPNDNGDWRAKYGKFENGHMIVEFLVEVFSSSSPADWENLGRVICNYIHIKDPSHLPQDLQIVISMYNQILNSGRLCIAKSEEEFLAPKTVFDEREAVGCILEAMKSSIADLKRYEPSSSLTSTISSPATGSSSLGKEDPSPEWQDLCQFIRNRELKTHSNFFRSCLNYMEEYEKIKNGK